MQTVSFMTLKNNGRSLGTNLTAFLVIVTILSTGFYARAADMACQSLYKSVEKGPGSSYTEVLKVMQQDPYDPSHLPVQPITLFRKVGKSLIPSFNVAKRSREILQDTRDYRIIGEPKPIHPMGVGFEGVLSLRPTRWSGAFAGGNFPVLARASISQGNPFRYDPNTGKPQTRTSALALKIFPTNQLDALQKTAQVVFKQ